MDETGYEPMEAMFRITTDESIDPITLVVPPARDFCRVHGPSIGQKNGFDRRNLSVTLRAKQLKNKRETGHSPPTRARPPGPREPQTHPTPPR